MGLLDALIYGVRDVLNSSFVPFVRKSRIALGAGLVGTVDEANDCITLTAPGAGGGSPGGASGDAQINDGVGGFAGVGGTAGDILTYDGSAWVASPTIDLATQVTGTLDGANMAASSGSVPGSMSAADKTKLDGIQTQGAAVAISAFDIDWSLGGVYTKTLSGGADTFTFSNVASGKIIMVRIIGAGGTLAWPTVKWIAGTPPVQTASGTDVVTLFSDGTDVYGISSQDFS